MGATHPRKAATTREAHRPLSKPVRGSPVAVGSPSGLVDSMVWGICPIPIGLYMKERGTLQGLYLL